MNDEELEDEDDYDPPVAPKGTMFIEDLIFHIGSFDHDVCLGAVDGTLVLFQDGKRWGWIDTDNHKVVKDAR